MDEQTPIPTSQAPQVPMPPTDPAAPTMVPASQPAPAGQPNKGKSNKVNLILVIISFLFCWFFIISIPLAIIVLVRSNKGDKVRRLVLIALAATVVATTLVVIFGPGPDTKEKQNTTVTSSSQNNTKVINIQEVPEGYKEYSNVCFKTKVAAPGTIKGQDCAIDVAGGSSTLPYAQVYLQDQSASPALQKFMDDLQKSSDENYEKYKEHYPDGKYTFKFAVNKSDKINNVAAESVVYETRAGYKFKVYAVNVPKGKNWKNLGSTISSFLIKVYNGNPQTDPQFSGSSKVFIENFAFN